MGCQVQNDQTLKMNLKPIKIVLCEEQNPLSPAHDMEIWYLIWGHLINLFPCLSQIEATL